MYQVHRSTGVRCSRFTNGLRRREKGFLQTTNTDGDRSLDVSDTRSHCRQSRRNQRKRVRTVFRVRGSDKIYRTASRVRGVSHFTECADNQKTRLVGGTNKDLALLRVRGEGQHNTIRQVTLDGDRHESRTAHVRGMTRTPQCANDAALFQIGATKRTALEPVLRSS